MRFAKALFTIFLITACLEEINEPVTIKYDETIDLVVSLELNGNFINSANNPALIECGEVMENLNNYLIIDIRNESQFSEGHIETSINISPDEVIEYLKNLERTLYSKTVLVCGNGHNSAYIASLLRLLNYNDVYSLNFGIGYWNSKFSKVWLNNRSNSPFRGMYTTKSYPKASLQDGLPVLSFEDKKATVAEKLEQRINLLLKTDFERYLLTIRQFEDRYQYGLGAYGNSYLICYGDDYLYKGMAHTYFGGSPPTSFGGHPRSAKHYRSPTFADFMISEDLLTIPTNYEIVIYSYNGQRSAYLMAFLHMLGYDVKINEYGAFSMLGICFREENITTHYGKFGITYDTVYTPNPATEHGFWEEKVNDFPIVVGK